MTQICRFPVRFDTNARCRPSGAHVGSSLRPALVNWRTSRRWTSIRKTCGLQARLKWPNDVLLAGKKLGGVLVESAVDGDQVKHAIMGIGINVTMECENIEQLAAYATSLEATAQKEVSRDALLRNLLHEIDSLYLKLRQGQSPLAEWKALLDTLDQRVTVSFHEESHTGLAEDVDRVGNLLLRLDDGQLITLTAGDVTLQRPAAKPE